MVRQLNIKSAEKLLRKYKIPYPKSKLAKSKQEAVKYAKKLKYPVVLKTASEDILHKSDVGGVMINIKNQDELEEAYDSISRKTKSKQVFVQEMVQGTYVFIGMKHDPAFGPVLAFGLGGIFVEILKDVAFRVAPIKRSEALAMIKSIKGYPMLTGARGKEKVNIKLLTKILLHASKLAMKEKSIKEFDLNPIVIDSKEAKAVDARFIPC